MNSESAKVVREFFSDGTLRLEVEYKGKLQHGMLREWHSTGVLMRECSMVNGKHHGWSRAWTESGQVLGATHFINGKFSGPMISYSADGQAKSVEFYIDNRSVSRDAYDAARLTRPELPPCHFDVPPPPSMADLEREEPATLTDPAEADAFAESLLRSGAFEARGWLASPGLVHTLGEMESTLAREFVERLYSLGAAQVFIVGVTHDNGYEHSNDVIVELPKSKRKRRQIFRHASEHAEQEGFDGETDAGQRYLYYKL